MKKYSTTILVSLLVVAFVIRLILLNFTIDIPGDGPSRATIAYAWSKAPEFLNQEVYGNWPPGFTYIVGTFSFIFNNPLYTARFINLIIGTLTIPLFYILVRKIFTDTTALLSASILALLPLHIGLSVSSLTEASVLFEVIAAMITLIIASEKTKGKIFYLSLSILFLSWAEMTRYEVWLLIPVFSIYYFLKTKKAFTAISIGICLLIFPTFWIISSYLATGDLLYGFSEGIRGAEAIGTKSANLIISTKIIAKKLLSNLGPIIVITFILGGILQIIQAVKSTINTEKIFYISVVFLNWIVMFIFAIKRGQSLIDRFLLIAFVMSLPLAVLPLVHYLRNSLKRLILFTLAVITSIWISVLYFHPQIYVTYEQPTEIKNLANWLQTSSYNKAPILLTKMDWYSTYLPLYYPEVARHFLIISFWASDSKIENFLKTQNPSLLITRDSDREFQSRIEVFLNRKIDINELIHTEGEIKVYGIKTEGLPKK